MSVATINNHVLFGQSADWRLAPSVSRVWQTETSMAVDGKQSRNSLRSVARYSLSFLITPEDVVAQAKFDDAVRQAKKFGLACAPFWGKGCRIDGTATGTEVVCGRGWNWQAGDFAYVENNLGFEISEVEAAAYDEETGLWTLTLADAVAGDYSMFVRPLLFGKFACDDMTILSPKTGPLKITINEQTSSRSVRIGDLPVEAVGIGEMAIGTTFIVA